MTHLDRKRTAVKRPKKEATCVLYAEAENLIDSHSDFNHIHTGIGRGNPRNYVSAEVVPISRLFLDLSRHIFTLVQTTNKTQRIRFDYETQSHAY